MNLLPSGLAPVDNRTVIDILFPNPFKGQETPPSERTNWPKSWTQWKTANQRAWSLYASTWDGFWTSKGFLVQTKEEQAEALRQQEFEGKEEQSTIQSVRNKEFRKQSMQQLQSNVQKNTEFLRDESAQAREQFQNATGIRSTDDLKRIMGDMLKIFTECVREFMNGYRQGRDDETEKVLTQYFQEIKQEVSEKIWRSKTAHKRRKRKTSSLATCRPL
jgi:hypothetical protein